MKALVFTLGDGWLGLRLDQVHEIVRVPPRMRELAGTPSSIAGLLDVRGRVVTLIDTWVLLAGAVQAEEGVGGRDTELHAAILHEPGRGVGFLVPEDACIETLGQRKDPMSGGLDPFLAGAYRRAGANSETSGDADEVVLLDPGVILETCRDEVRSRFLTRTPLEGAGEAGSPGRDPGDSPESPMQAP